MSKQATRIQCVALKPLTVSGRLFDRPPGDGRRNNYMFRLPTAAAAALAKRQRLLPAYDDDARTLERETGYRIGSYFGSKAPKTKDAEPSEEPAEATEPPSEPVIVEDDNGREAAESVATETLLETALRTKKKADLVAALEAEGLDPADYTNNTDRLEALEGLA